ncbi:Crp/Fnr family transcriptional regulator [Brevibacillus sp. NRS-1366]|uniref:Crp/Fnr family transcriptional regulator n=1 Tax=Brevibacillus sp. NRS-1366 TaxID=3233899 RepID=UPI003D1B5BE8
MTTLLDKAECPFSALWQPYLKYGQRMYFQRKSIIFTQGKSASGFYFVLKGLIKTVTVKPEGQEKILEFLGPGKLLGECGLDLTLYYSTAIAAEDSVVYFFSLQHFKHLSSTYPDFVTLFLNSLNQKIRILSEENTLTALSAEQQIAYTLLKMKRVCKSNRLSITQQDIASFTSLTRITVYKIFKKWKESNLIDIQQRTIIIKKPAQLLAFFQESIS